MSSVLEQATARGEEAYLRVFQSYSGLYGLKSLETIHEQPVCKEWSRDTYGLLLRDNIFMSLGAKLAIKRFVVDEKSNALHDYVELQHKNQTYLLDGTWQQFLDPDRRSPELPRILSGNYDFCVAFAIEAGMDPIKQIVWDDRFTERLDVHE